MTLEEMMKYGEKIEEELKKCKISEISYSRYEFKRWYKMEYNGLEEKYFESTLSDSKDEYRKLVALDNLTHVLDDNNPIEYAFTKCFIEKVQLYDTYENKTLTSERERGFNDKMFFEEYLEKLKSLINYLGKDYQIPEYIIQNKLSIDSENYSSIFSFDDENIQKFLADINQELLYKVVETNNQTTTEKPILLARIMDSKEFESFKTNGVVSGIDYDGERVWDEYNKGESGDYTFMAFRNAHDALTNFTAIIPYFKPSKFCNENGENKYLIFFSANNINEKMCYQGRYSGRDLSRTCDYGFEGYDKSFEVALPFYDENNFTVLSCTEIDENTIERVFIDELENMDILSLSIEDLNSEIYNDFMNSFSEEYKEYLDKHCKGDHIDENYIKDYLKYNPDMACYSYDELKEMIRVEDIRPRFIYEFEEYYEDKLMHNEYFSLSDMSTDALKFAKIVQEEYNIPKEDAYKIAGNIIQKIDNWYYSEPERDYYDDEEYDDDYDEEYDEDQNDMEEDEEYLGPYAEYYEDEYYL